MANPTNTGIGTGSAQIFDTSNVDNAISNLANIKFKKDAMYGEGQAKQQAKKQAELAEIQGEFKDFDRTKLRLSDYDLFTEKKNNLLKKYDGQWGKVLNGDPKLANEYRRDVDDIHRLISRSVDTKGKVIEHLKLIEGNPLYSKAYVDKFKIMATTPDWNFEEALRNGELGRDQIRPDFMNNLSGLFVDNGQELYDVTKNEIPLGNGQTSVIDSKQWKPDEEAFPKFKATIGIDPEMLTDINIKYADIELPEERIKAAYDHYKISTEQNEEFKKITGSAREPKTADESKTEMGSTYTEDTEEGSYKGVSLNDDRFKKPILFSYMEEGKKGKNVIFGRPVEIFLNDNDEYMARILPVKETQNFEGELIWSPTGEPKVIKLGKKGSGFGAFNSAYKTNPEEIIKHHYGNKEEENTNTSSSAPSKGDVVGGYVFLGGNPSDQKNWKKQ